MGEIVLVLGGARSGKSSFAEKYVLHKGAQVAYIATAEVLDEEMERRVAYHRARRKGGRWLNYEAPYHAEKAMADAGERAEAILFDCVTVYVSNLMYGEGAPSDFDAKYAYVRSEIKRLVEAAQATQKTVVFVSNEVGCGVVPQTVMGREFRDIAGWINQLLGEEADHVYYCIAGQAVDIKKLAFSWQEA